MARKNVDKILSGTLLALCIVFFCTIDGSSQSFVGGKMKFAVSGSTGTGNVLLKGLGTGGFVSSDSSGNYSVEIEYGWSGVVTPEKPGFTFEPSNLKIGPVKGPITGKDFTAKPITFTISGSVGDAGAGVKLADLPSGPVVSDAKGQYTATVEFGWNGKIMPIKDGFVFTPDQKPYTDVKQNFSNQNYTAKPVTYTIAGSVGVPGVRMEGLPGNVISGATGALARTTKGQKRQKSKD